MSPDSYRLRVAVVRGFRPISHRMLHPKVLATQCKTYSEGAASAGRVADASDRSVSRNIFVGDSTESAVVLARDNSLGRCLQYIRDFTARYAPKGLSIWKPDENMTDDECNLDYFMREVVIAGDPRR